MKFTTYILLFAACLSCVHGCQHRGVTFLELKEQTPWGIEVFLEPVFPSSEVSIKDFGAKTEPGYNNQNAIQQAIDAINHKGGGRVIVPAGTWETAYIELRSNVNLVIE
jgi:hypothetical protein